MRVSLKLLMLFVTLMAISVCVFTYETPISRLKKKNAVFGGKTTGDLFLMGFPNQWENYIQQNVSENEGVEVIAFPSDADLSEIDFRSLANFDNLVAISVRSKIPPNWIRHLSRCRKLRVFSYASSAADDEAVEQMIEVSSLQMINVPGRKVSLDVKKRFRDSKTGRIAYP